MTLTNRLTIYFLTAQVVVLVAFSFILYALAWHHLHAQAEDRLSKTMDTLVALAEIEPDGLDWEPELRRLPAHWEGDPPLWAVYDETGTRLDGSKPAGQSLGSFVSNDASSGRQTHRARWNESDWQITRQTLVFSNPDLIRSRPGRERHLTLAFVAGMPMAPVQSALRNLAWGLLGVSSLVWVLSGLAARLLCRRALAPVRQMTDAVKKISADALAERLPPPEARDELRELVDNFNDLLSRLQDSFERQQRFTGDASHQLRTPLAGMLGQMEVALRRVRTPDEYQRVIGTAIAQADRLRQIVDSLLFLARADAESDSIRVSAVRITTWLPEYLRDSWAEHPRFNDIRVDVSGHEEAIVWALPTLLGQAVGNLLENAIKYTAAGSLISLRLMDHGDELALIVEDQGPGIAEEDLPHIFEPFYRSADAQRRGIAGVGLGLAVTARIATALGGRVRVSSGWSGSRFELFLQASCEKQSESA